METSFLCSLFKRTIQNETELSCVRELGSDFVVRIWRKEIAYKITTERSSDIHTRRFEVIICEQKCIIALLGYHTSLDLTTIGYLLLLN